jgi:hypothetical protein
VLMSLALLVADVRQAVLHRPVRRGRCLASVALDLASKSGAEPYHSLTDNIDMILLTVRSKAGDDDGVVQVVWAKERAVAVT